MIQYQTRLLSNGLTVIAHQDLRSGMGVVNLLYDVGSRDEQPERTGFAHLFEHLMFGGSANIPDYDRVAQKMGLRTMHSQPATSPTTTSAFRLRNWNRLVARKRPYVAARF